MDSPRLVAGYDQAMGRDSQYRARVIQAGEAGQILVWHQDHPPFWVSADHGSQMMFSDMDALSVVANLRRAANLIETAIAYRKTASDEDPR